MRARVRDPGRDVRRVPRGVRRVPGARRRLTREHAARWSDHLRGLPAGHVRPHGDPRYLTVAAAIDALDWLEANAYVVLGFDGLDAEPPAIRPRLDRIADFSSIEGAWEQRVGASIADSRRLLATWLGDVDYVDLVVEEPQETT